MLSVKFVAATELLQLLQRRMLVSPDFLFLQEAGHIQTTIVHHAVWDLI